jgi:hypothetical protein
VRYIHLTKAKRSLFVRDKPILSSERMLDKDSGRKGSFQKKSLVVISKGLAPRQTDWRYTASGKVTLTLTLTLCQSDQKGITKLFLVRTMRLM